MIHGKTFLTDYTIKGNCSQCGQCCGDILHLSKSEIERIDKFIKKNKIKATERCILVEYDNTCPFRNNKEKKCNIYEVRPDICRVFQCDKSPEEAYRNRELINANKLPRSMRNLFFGDNEGAKWLNETLGMPIYDRNNKIIK